MKEIIDNIKNSFNSDVSLVEKRQGIYQIYLPIYHEDGDMIDLFLMRDKVGNYILCDFGLTLQRLSYEYDLDTPNKEAILERILSENDLLEEDGNISIYTQPNNVFQNIMQITQAYAKIGSMRYFKREVIESLFMENVWEYIETELQEFKPKKIVYPIPSRNELEVDFQLTPNGHPIYLFGVKDVNKARLATISCLEFLKNKLNFKAWVVHENYSRLPKKDIARLTNACDKQFTDLEEFQVNVKAFLEKERG